MKNSHRLPKVNIIQLISGYKDLEITLTFNSKRCKLDITSFEEELDTLRITDVKIGFINLYYRLLAEEIYVVAIDNKMNILHSQLIGMS